MKLAEWARANGVGRSAAYRWFHAGILPVPAVQLPTGTILVQDHGVVLAATSPGTAALYARVSSADQKADLERLLGRLVAFAAGAGLRVDRTVAEVGSWLNGNRPKLRRLLADPAITTIVVEHRERLVGFGVEYLEAALPTHRRRLVVVEEKELDDDLVRDVTEVLTSLCAQLPEGVRSACFAFAAGGSQRSDRHRAEAALTAAGAYR